MPAKGSGPVFRIPYAAILLALVTALAACGHPPEAPEKTLARAQANLARQMLANPFQEGPVQVLSAQNGQLRGYQLFACRQNSRVCGGSAQGRAGKLYRSAEFDVIKGAYRGVTFYLEPGGRGYLVKHGHRMPLAWDQIDAAG